MKRTLLITFLAIFSVPMSTLSISDFSNYILTKVYAGDDDCEDKAFKKYLKKGEKPFENYLDRADDVPLPNDEDDIDEYLDEINPLANDYIDDLEPHAEKYIEDLEDCLGE